MEIHLQPQELYNKSDDKVRMLSKIGKVNNIFNNKELEENKCWTSSLCWKVQSKVFLLSLCTIS